MNENLKVSGRLNVLLTDEHGKVKINKDFDNVVVNGGKAYIARCMWEPTASATPSGSTFTLASHGLIVNDEIIFTNLNGNTGVSLNTLYYVLTAPTGNTFTISASEGGGAITITGTNAMTFRYKPNQMNYMAVGTDTTLYNDATKTALVAETGTRQTVNTTQTTTTVTNDTIQYVATFGAGVATGTLGEAGVFTSLTDGTMLCRTVFGGASPSTINKQSTDTLTITWKVTVA